MAASTLYGAGGFPTLSYNASNYWVDVVLTTTPPVDNTRADGDGLQPGQWSDQRADDRAR